MKATSLKKEVVNAKRSGGELDDRGQKRSGQQGGGAKQQRRGELQHRASGEADGVNLASTMQTRINKRKMFANSTVLARLLKAGRVNQEDVARTLESAQTSQAATGSQMSLADFDQHN